MRYGQRGRIGQRVLCALLAGGGVLALVTQVWSEGWPAEWAAWTAFLGAAFGGFLFGHFAAMGRLPGILAKIDARLRMPPDRTPE